jgi:serine/threonine-protein kinase HipA
MNGVVVGSLTKTKQSGMVFQYNDNWLSSSQARPLSLSMPLRRDPYSGSEVFNYFDNLLPDRKNIRDRVISRFKVESDHPFDILSAIGSDCVGAIQVYSEQPSTRPRPFF